MTHSFTTTFPSNIYTFLITESKKRGLSRNKIIQEALKLYKREQLRQKIKSGLITRQVEMKELAAETREAQVNTISK